MDLSSYKSGFMGGSQIELSHSRPGVILIYQSTQTYVVDAFTPHAASGSRSSRVPDLSPPIFLTALAAVTCLRALAGFGFPLFAPVMF